MRLDTDVEPIRAIFSRPLPDLTEHVVMNSADECVSQPLRAGSFSSGSIDVFIISA